MILVALASSPACTGTSGLGTDPVDAKDGGRPSEDAAAEDAAVGDAAAGDAGGDGGAVVGECNDRDSGRSPGIATKVDFDVAKLYPTGAGYVFPIRAADLNGDGRADLVIPTSKPETGLEICLASGEGTYPHAADLAYVNALDVGVGDLNGDGNADVVVGGGFNWTMILFGDGRGGLDSRLTIDAALTFSPVVADIDGDGNADIVGGGGDVSILKGHGDGTFESAVSLGMGTFAYQVAAVDVSGDGKLDLVTLNGHAHDATPVVSLRLGLGGGAFGSVVSTAIAPRDGVQVGYAREFATADFNGDGRTDIVVVDSKGVSILDGSSTGALTASRRFAASLVPDTAAAATGDFDRDGDADLAVVSSSDSLLTVLLGDGHGGFGDPVRYATGGFTSEIAVADANGDGISDLILSNGHIIVILGRGDGSFRAAPVLALPGAARPLSVAASDIDGDDHTDVVIAASAGSSNVVTTFLNGGGTAGWRLGAVVQSAAASTVSLACMDGDGARDLLFGSSDSQVGVAHGDGRGGFSSPEYFPGGTGRLIVADFDGDGDRDVAATHGAEVVLFVNEGTGALRAHAVYTADGGRGARMVAADMNGDRKLDLIVNTYPPIPDGGSVTFSSEVLVLLGAGDGSFRVGPITTLPAPVTDFAVGDFGADGNPDLLAALEDPIADLVFLAGDGRGGFTRPVQLGAGFAGQLIAADFNGDAKLDLLFTVTDGLRTALGHGDGTFDAGVFYPAATLFGPFAANLDDDGRPDFLMLSPSGYVAVFANASR
jgi:hypothetical protein